MSVHDAALLKQAAATKVADWFEQYYQPEGQADLAAHEQDVVDQMFGYYAE